MTLFWFEIAHFLIAIFGILVAVSAAALFFLVIRYERQLQTLWRAIGFTSLALTFLLFIFERKFPVLELPALITQAFAFSSIYIGVFSEPKLSQLLQIGKKPTATQHDTYQTFKNTVGKRSASPVTIFVFTLAAILLVGVFWAPFLPAFLAGLAALFIALTIPMQLRRYQREQDDLKARRLNLYPLLGYIALLLGVGALAFYRLPGLDLVAVRTLTLEYSSAWQSGQLLIFLGLLMLAMWAWTFIRVRPFLRTYVVFLTIAILVASLGSLIFTTLIFRIVERNNLSLMTQGVKAEDLVLQNRVDTALLVSRTIGNDDDILQSYSAKQNDRLRELVTEYLNNSSADSIRLFDQGGKIIVSPTDERDEGRVIADDKYLNFVLTERKQLKTFDTRPGILSPEILARGLYPILDDSDAVIGAIEVHYVFDNAFVDFSKGKTGLDVSIYAGKKRSATTILTLDEISRWTGSEETERAVIEPVLNDGKLVSLALDRLGRPYYSAFQPIKNVNGEIIGMASVGTPTNTLFEETRQQLITTFLIVMLISLVVALVGYLAIRSFSGSTKK